MRCKKVFVVLFILAFAKALQAQSTRPQCYLVNAKSGLKLRAEASLEGRLIETLPYGAQVIIIPAEKGVRGSVLDNGSRVEGSWVKVKTLFHDYNASSGNEGFVFDYYLSKHLDDLPAESLHNFTDIYSFEEQTELDIPSVNARDELYKLGTNCNVRYEYNPAAKRALADIIQFKTVDYSDYKERVLLNPYKLDQSFVPKRFPVKDSMAAREGFTQYYLPINKGRDSVLVKDDTGEWGSVTEYLGYIKELDAYFATGFAEDQEIIKIDQKTGERSLFANGNFSISPEGTFLVSAYSEIFDQLTAFRVSFLDDKKKGFEIKFTSWFPVGALEWISEREFLMPVLPMDRRNENPDQSEPIYLLGQIKI
ncbi:SH3 domain-containing protein [Nonlabens spongiae]|uniref:SH3 domain-containing protein n=1 Tax=Nonlabens spongiae TaxID=331648 RepID=UPI000A2727EA|nr:SH3 domain-containing protein [Nonlabens spongiae]